MNQFTPKYSLSKGAQAHGFPGEIWTWPRVNEVIKELFGVSYDPSQIGRLLEKAGWSRQNLKLRLASKTCRRWPTGENKPYPLSKKAQTEGRVILYIDESTCYLLPLLAHTWAPRGQTPVLLEHVGRAHLSLIAAVAPNGRLYVAGQDQAFTSEDIVWF